MIEVIILNHYSQLFQSDIDALCNYISLKKQEHIKKLQYRQDKCNSILGDVLARSELCRITGLKNDELEFSVNLYGKPYLVNFPDIHFNLSHAGDYVAFAVSNKPIGIDIELIGMMNTEVIDRFFSLDEKIYVQSYNSVYRFFEVWTKKESRIKCEGQGLHKPLSSFSVFESAKNTPLFYKKVFQDDNTICHICSKQYIKPSVRIINLELLMQWVKNMDKLSHNIVM